VTSALRRAWKPASLQARVLLGVIGVVLLLWGAAAWRMAVESRHEIDEIFDGHLAQAAALLVVQAVRDLDDGEERDDDDRVEAPQLHRYAPKVAFQVWHEGRLAMRSSNAPAQPMWAGGRLGGLGLATVDVDGQAWRVFAARGAEADVQVFVGEQMASRTDIQQALMRSTLWPMALALPLLALAAWWAVRRGLLPLQRLGQQIAVRPPQALEPVAMDEVPVEMAPLLEALNGLFTRIGSMVQAERRFTADAAHELRTPIAAIRTQAQVAMAEGDEALRAHALQQLLTGCDRATRLVEQLLMLSRLEARAATAELPEAAVIDLAALTRRVVAEAAPAALDKGQTLSLQADEACPARADEMLAAVLVRNLVDNAVRYSPPGAQIVVGVSAAGGGAHLNVEDSGPGLADADLERLGERFFRVLGTGQSGSGLGWSIVRRVAAVQGARVTLQRSAALSGLQVRVDWPAV